MEAGVHTSPWAILAGYAGIFSVLLIPAPIALILGIIAFWHVRAKPGRKGLGRAIFAILMGTFFSILLLCVLWGTFVVYATFLKHSP